MSWHIKEALRPCVASCGHQVAQQEWPMRLNRTDRSLSPPKEPLKWKAASPNGTWIWGHSIIIRKEWRGPQCAGIRHFSSDQGCVSLKYPRGFPNGWDPTCARWCSPINHSCRFRTEKKPKRFWMKDIQGWINVMLFISTWDLSNMGSVRVSWEEWLSGLSLSQADMGLYSISHITVAHLVSCSQLFDQRHWNEYKNTRMNDPKCKFQHLSSDCSEQSTQYETCNMQAIVIWWWKLWHVLKIDDTINYKDTQFSILNWLFIVL